MRMRHRNNTLPFQCLYSRVAGLPFCGPLNAFRNDPEDNVGVGVGRFRVGRCMAPLRVRFRR